MKVWDVAGGFCTHVLKGHGGVVSAVAWHVSLGNTNHNSNSSSSSNSEKQRKKQRVNLFTGSVDGRVRYWDLLLAAASGSGSGSDSASGGGGVQHRPVQMLGAHVSVIRGLAVSSDGARLVSASRDRTIALWQLRERSGASTSTGAAKKQGKGEQQGTGEEQEWKQVGPVIDASEGVECAGFLRSSSAHEHAQRREKDDLFYTAGSSGEVRIWSFAKRGLVAKEELHDGLPSAAASGGKGAGEEGEDEEDETRAIQELHQVPGAAAGALVAVHADQTFSFHSYSHAAGERTVRLTKQMVGYNDQVTDVVHLSTAVGGQSSRAAAAAVESHLAIATNSPSIHVYTMPSADGEQRRGHEEHSVDILRGHSENVLALDRACDGKAFASGSRDRTARIWSSARRADGDGGLQWKCLAVAQGHTESVGALAFARREATAGSEDRPAAALGSSFLVTASSDRTVKVWDLSALPAPTAEYAEPARLRSLTTLKIHDKDINSLDVAPNNALLISGSQDRTAKVFTLAYSAPSKANGNIASATLKPLATCKGHKRGVWCVRFSPVDRAFATASGDRTIKLWSLNDFTCVKTFEGHTNSVLRVDFLTAGMQLLSTAADGLVKLWNVKDEQCAWTGDAHDEQVWSLSISKDEGQAVTVGADSMVRVWQDRTAVDEAEKRQKMVEEVQQ